MKLNESMPDNCEASSEASDRLVQLLARCHDDLKFTDQILSALEEPFPHKANGVGESLLSASNSDSLAQGGSQAQDLGSLGAEAVRRLTNNIEALSSAAARSDVQLVLQAMYISMVRCVKFLPLQVHP